MNAIAQKVYQTCLQTRTLNRNSHACDVASVLAAAIQAVDPYAAVQKNLERTQASLRIGQATYDQKRVHLRKVVGAGKASPAMLQAALDVIGDQLEGGCVIAKHFDAENLQTGLVPVLKGSHPIPDEQSVRATRRLLSTLQGSRPDDLILCLLSGGGSALMTAPLPGITLADMQSITAKLLTCGATIQEINTLRKHLDAAKGGRLAHLAYPASMACLILSDVVGNPLDIIASGPTVPDRSTYADCWEIVTRYALERQIPASIVAVLQAGVAGEIAETPKPGDPTLARTSNTLVGSNRQAALAGLAQAQALGYHTLLLTTYLQGEARLAGQFIGAIARQVAESGEPVARPACIAIGGETTVSVHGAGRGGRNQELALGSVDHLAGIAGCLLVTFASDGEDGPTDAAGALVSGETRQQARTQGLEPDGFLQENDSYNFFQAMGDLLTPGPTGTNVNDLAFLWLF
ncbi:MAG: glycerate kinase type-2 family protein [Chloroflexota bacterium]